MSPVRVDWDPMTPGDETEPTAAHRRLRELPGAAYADRFGGFYTLARYADVVAAAADPATYSSARKATIPDTTGASRPPRPPLESDPPTHGEFRTLLNKYFAPRRIRALEPAIRRTARELLAAAITAGEVDAVEAITYPMPSQVLCTFIGIPTAEGATLKAMANEVLDAATSGAADAHKAANDRIYAYIDALVQRRRDAPQDPEVDVVSGLLSARIGDRPLSVDEVSAVLRLLLQAGHGTTTNALGSTLRYLAEHPDEQRRLRADRSLVPAAIEEILRVWTPARLLARTTERDVQVGSTLIPADSKVALMWSAANRDPSVFENADEVRIDRRPNRHVAFGHGIHTCLGAPLARAELHLFVAELFALTDWVEPAGEPADAGWPHIGPISLPLRFRPRTTPLPPAPARRAGRDTETEVVVSKITEVADGVRELALRRPDGSALPSWSAGAHLELALPNGLSRQYSLCGDRSERDAWRVAVLREPAGRGGSAYVHDVLTEGDTLTVRGPRNHFPLAAAESYLFLASGIGITPMLPMIRQARDSGANVELHYVGRTAGAMSYADRLRHNPWAHLHVTSEGGRPDLAALLAEVRPGTLIYACGSVGFLEAAEAATAHWPAGSFHVEWFSPKPGAAEAGEGALEAFEVVLERSGATVDVIPGQSIIDACESVGVTIPGSCFEGTCGSCETPLLEGVADHRDSVLSAEERAEGTYLMPCVSRAMTPRLVLDA